MFDLNGTLAIVTGAAKGNGKAIFEALNTAGATVVGVDLLKIDNPLSIQGKIQDESILENIIKVVSEDNSKKI